MTVAVLDALPARDGDRNGDLVQTWSTADDPPAVNPPGCWDRTRYAGFDPSSPGAEDTGGHGGSREDESADEPAPLRGIREDTGGHWRSPGDTGGHPENRGSGPDLVHTRPRLLDLFCGVGGCSVGYARAGFDVVGVDHVPQPDYPFSFVLADAITFPLDGFDAIHASPPCKRFSVTQAVHRHRLRLFDPNDDLLTPTLERLRASGLPWIVENVPGAPMPPDSVTLCGSAFGLAVRRHRLFAGSGRLVGSVCRHSLQARVVGVYGDGGAWTRTAPGGGGTKVVGQDAADALGIDWTTDQRRLAQAIPPDYTDWIGRQVIEWL